MPIAPYNYQKEVVYAIERNGGRSLVSLDMGLGKTLVALWTIRRHPEMWPAVVVCPASVKYMWAHQALENIGVRASVLEGMYTPQPPDGGLVGPPRLLIVNYDILHSWLPYINEVVKPRTLILDECQKLINRETKRTRASVEIGRAAAFVLALSGTPLTNRPAELWPVLNILWPDKYDSFWSYANEYCEVKKGYHGWDYRGASSLQKLHDELVAAGMVRRLKSDVLKELPEKVRQIIPVPMADPNEYRRAEKDFIAWLHRTDPAAARRAGRAKKLSQLGYLRRIAAQQKVPAVVSYMNDFLESSDEKLIVFGIHKGMIRALREGCKAKAVTIDGGVVGRARRAAELQFQNDSKTRVMIGSEAAYVGLTLTAASNVMLTELPWRPGDVTQAEDRAHRIGQTRTSFNHYLVAADTVESRICRILQTKQDIIRTVLDGGGGEGDGLEIYDLLCEEMAAAA